MGTNLITDNADISLLPAPISSIELENSIVDDIVMEIITAAALPGLPFTIPFYSNMRVGDSIYLRSNGLTIGFLQVLKEHYDQMQLLQVYAVPKFFTFTGKADIYYYVEKASATSTPNTLASRHLVLKIQRNTWPNPYEKGDEELPAPFISPAVYDRTAFNEQKELSVRIVWPAMQTGDMVQLFIEMRATGLEQLGTLYYPDPSPDAQIVTIQQAAGKEVNFTIPALGFSDVGPSVSRVFYTISPKNMEWMQKRSLSAPWQIDIISVDEIPLAPTGLLVSIDGTKVTGMGESGDEVRVYGSNGTFLGNGTVRANSTFSVTLTSVQTHGEWLSVTQVSPKGIEGPGGPVQAPEQSISLWVVGARGNSNSYQGNGVLVALDNNSRTESEARWQYEGEPVVSIGSRFMDIHPERTLLVSTSFSVVRLSPQNIALSDGACAVRLDSGQIVTWGNAANGGVIPPAVANLSDIIQVIGGEVAFAALRANGSVVAWGKADFGGTVPSEVASLHDIVQLLAGGYGTFAALRANGSVVAWGDATAGGSVPSKVANLCNIVQIYGGKQSFAALLEDGAVVAWGNAANGGNVPPAVSSLHDVVKIVGGSSAFVALRADNSIVAWGDKDCGLVPESVAILRDIVQVVGGDRVFAALRSNGSVVAWGVPGLGGVVPVAVANLVDIIQLVGSSFGAFAALRANGSIVAWGEPEYGGTVPNGLANLRDIVLLVGCHCGFAAMRRDGSLVAWGYVSHGATIPERVSALRNLRAVYGGPHDFAVLDTSNSPISWDPVTGNRPTNTVGHVSYEQE